MDIDLSYLEEITEGDNDMMLEMLTLFVEDIPLQINSITEHAASEDLASIGADCHKLKPSLQYVGLSSMYQMVKRLEELGKAGIPSAEIAELVHSLQEESIVALSTLEEKKNEFS